MFIFDHFYEKYNKDRWGRCTKTECFTTAFLMTAILALVGVLLMGGYWFLDSEDVGEGSRERNKLEDTKEAQDFEMSSVTPKNIQLK